MDMGHLLLALGITLAFYLGRSLYRGYKNEPIIQAEIQSLALEVLRERTRPISSGTLMVEVERRMGERLIGFGTYARAMDKLVERGAVRRIYRPKKQGGDGFIGYELPNQLVNPSKT